MSAYARIEIRDAATLSPGLSPISEASSPERKFRINFRHPAYAPADNLLFTLYAWDHADGGLHHGVAHCACSIFADNRIDGYLSRTCNTEYGDRIDTAWDDVLPSKDADYYFYVPHPSEFQVGVSTAAQSSLTAAIRKRDNTCRVTAFESGTEAAHLIPEHERQWFLTNSMGTWNTDLSLDPSNLLRDLSNSVLLRSDIHTSFDQRKFVFFPKGANDLVVHMLEPTIDIGPLYHNTRICIPHCGVEFLYARFAWATFPTLSVFLSKPGISRLVVRTRAGTGERVTEEVTNAILLAKRATASRSTSPTKRSKAVAELDDRDTEHDHSKRYRTSRETSSSSSSKTTLPALDENLSFEAYLSTEQARIENLRREALIQQRPKGYDTKLPPYDMRRPAIEELETMGVEIRDELDDVDLDWE